MKQKVQDKTKNSSIIQEIINNSKYGVTVLDIKKRCDFNLTHNQIYRIAIRLAECGLVKKIVSCSSNKQWRFYPIGA
ncbi:MAG: hypothetical protein LBG21_04095 [Campylobacteraceae bacterium]|jgi:hypothetical protein|nr:hypothetical protein [Campylobacteraceae bacterium]